jgi:hypothetical protein
MLPPKNSFTKPALARLIEDGTFGTKTLAMVKEFQRLNQVTIDGAVGPVTSYLLFPFIFFTATLDGKGRIRGRRGEPLVARPLLSRALFGAAKAKDAPSGGGGGKVGGGDDDEGITIDLTAGSGNGNSFKPWFVLKPNEENEAPEAEGTIGIESTVLRLKGFEFGGGLEFSKPLTAQGGVWQWTGSITGAYTNIKTNDGVVTFSPIVDASVKQGLTLGAGIGAEASIHLLDDSLSLTVGGKLTAEVDPHEGSLQVGPAVSVGMKFKWDVVRFGKK